MRDAPSEDLKSKAVFFTVTSKAALWILVSESSRRPIRQPHGCELPFQVVQLLKAVERILTRGHPALPLGASGRILQLLGHFSHARGRAVRLPVREPLAAYFDSRLGVDWASWEGSASWVWLSYWQPEAGPESFRSWCPRARKNQGDLWPNHIVLLGFGLPQGGLDSSQPKKQAHAPLGPSTDPANRSVETESAAPVVGLCVNASDTL